MRFIRSIHAIDTHTMGQPTRIIVGGIPSIPGITMADKRQYMRKNLDYIRTAIMQEPRGHKDMFGAIITAPAVKEADLGILFMDCDGYLNMSGHASIGISTAAVECGMVAVQEPDTVIVLDTPAGLVKAKVRVENGKVKEVTVTNVPAFLYKSDVDVAVPDIGRIMLDISFGGSFFALVSATQLGIEIIPENAGMIIRLGLRIRDILNSTVKVAHPVLKHINTVDAVVIYDQLAGQNAVLKNAAVFGAGSLNRSPSGTGLSALIASMFAKGRIRQDEECVFKSIVGTQFKARASEVSRVGVYDALTIEITGSAKITGFNHYVIDPDDMFRYGFYLKGC